METITAAFKHLDANYYPWIATFFLALGFSIYVYLVPTSIDFFTNPADILNSFEGFQGPDTKKSSGGAKEARVRSEPPVNQPQ
jgi:hypothetical protein